MNFITSGPDLICNRRLQQTLRVLLFTRILTNSALDCDEQGSRLLKLFHAQLNLFTRAHEILNAHQYKNIAKFSIFQAQISLE